MFSKNLQKNYDTATEEKMYNGEHDDVVNNKYKSK